MGCGDCLGTQTAYRHARSKPGGRQLPGPAAHMLALENQVLTRSTQCLHPRRCGIHQDGNPYNQEVTKLPKRSPEAPEFSMPVLTPSEAAITRMISQRMARRACSTLRQPAGQRPGVRGMVQAQGLVGCRGAVWQWWRMAPCSGAARSEQLAPFPHKTSAASKGTHQ